MCFEMNDEFEGERIESLIRFCVFFGMIAFYMGLILK